MKSIERLVFRGASGSEFRAQWVEQHAKIVRTLVDAPGHILLREIIRDPAGIGAICSSSRRLAARMAAHVDPLQEGWVVELGGGTGAITAALLQRGICADRLIVIERSSRLARYLRRRFPGVRVIHGDAADVEITTRGKLPVRTIVSGLPLRSLPGNAANRIIRACMRTLPMDGRLIQFTYALRAKSPWQVANLDPVASETVWFNLPPARIEVFQPYGSPAALDAIG